MVNKGWLVVNYWWCTVQDHSFDWFEKRLCERKSAVEPVPEGVWPHLSIHPHECIFGVNRDKSDIVLLNVS